jgi:hypothetical protein
MPPEPRLDSRPGSAESSRSGVGGRTAGAEEEQSALVATADWTIAPTPIPPTPPTPSSSLCGCTARARTRSGPTATTSPPSGASPANTAARHVPVGSAAIRGSLVGAPASRGRRLKTLKSLLSFATPMGYLPFNAGAAIHGPGPRAEARRADSQRTPSLRVARDGRRSAARPRLDPSPL